MLLPVLALRGSPGRPDTETKDTPRIDSVGLKGELEFPAQADLGRR